MRPLCIDLFCGLGGWTDGFLAEGYEVVGFDIEQHAYGTERYPAHLVLQDVLTIHGRQFKDAAVIVASSPCQAYSYMAMPWTRAKQIARALRGEGDFPDGYTGYRTVEELNALFEAPKRIQREAIEAAGRFIPMIQENVRGAIPWVGRSAWNFGSYHLWGDVPALMPMTAKAHKVPGFRFDGSGGSFQTASVERDGIKLGGGASWAHPDDPKHTPGLDFTRLAGVKVAGLAPGRFPPGGLAQGAIEAERGQKNTGGSWFNIGSPGQKVVNRNPVHEGTKQPGLSGVRENGKGDRWLQDGAAKSGSKSSARKAASARIAKIPFPLAQHVARVYRPETAEVAA